MSERKGRSSGQWLSVAIVVLATTIGAQIEPMAATEYADAVPGTLQTLALLVGGALLGPRLGAFALTIYLALGLTGVPLFHDWKSRPLLEFALYPSAGYVGGFIPGAAFAGWCARKSQNLIALFAAMLGGHLIILACGVPVLAAYAGIEAAVDIGLIALLPGMAVKTLLGTAILSLYYARLARRTSSISS